MADRKGLLSPIDVQGLLAARSQGLLGSMPTGEMRAHVPSLRDRIGNMVFDAATAMGLRQSAQRMRSDAGMAMDFVPGVGDVVGAQEAGRAFGAGRYGDAALGASLAAVGAMPVVGDAVAGAAKKGIRAFHGSPHSFDKFDLSKIGTGEGAQAYGHGLYFAENEGVARSYRDALSGDIKYQGAPKDFVQTTDNRSIGVHNVLKRLSETNETPEQAISMVRQDVDDRIASLQKALADPVRSGTAKEYIAHSLENWKAAREGMDKIKATDFEMPSGSMYEVNINADPDDFLDWDKPLSEQKHKGVVVTHDPGLTGGSAVQSLNARFGDKTTATQYLKERGIPGIKYLDAGSRNAGDGSRNFVVFDDALIEIVRKYGIPAALGAGIITQEMAEQMQAQGLGT